MADEITVTVGLQVTNGNLIFRLPNITKTFNQTTARAGQSIQNVGTTQETASYGADLAPGWILLQNLDDTNFVDYGTVTADLGFQLPAGNGLGLVYLKSGDTLYLKADTAACDVRITTIDP